MAGKIKSTPTKPKKSAGKKTATAATKTTPRSKQRGAGSRMRKGTPAKAPPIKTPRAIQDEVQAALSSLQKMSTQRDRENLARFGIFGSEDFADKAFGVSMTNIQKLAKQLGRNHELAAALWESGWYEARMLTSFVDEPDCVTPAQMDRWCRDFDNWGICDTLCFCLFDRTPHAWNKVAQWSLKSEVFMKRAAFALLWGLTVHDKASGDEPFVEGLVFVECAASDDRHYVKKAVNMALRAIGKRSPALHAAAVAVSKRLAASPQAAAQWIGKDALRELTSPAVTRRLAARQRSHSRKRGLSQV